MSRTALVLGASGLVGRHLLARLAADARWTRVVTLDRRPLEPVSDTHQPNVVDFDRLGDLEPALWASDDLFCALGTTIKTAGSRDAFRRVDLEIPAEAARRAHAAGATQMLLVSAMGADAGSRIFYNRVKGEAEDAVRAAGFEAVQIARPSLLRGAREETRVGESVAAAFLRLGEPLLVGPLAALRPIHARTVADALVALAGARPPGADAYGPDELRWWARQIPRTRA